MTTEELKSNIIKRLETLPDAALQEVMEYLQKLDEQKIIHLTDKKNINEFVEKNDSLLNRLAK